MVRLKVIVRKLNKRNKIPAYFPEPGGIVGTVWNGFQFEGAEVVTNIPNPSLGKWYADRDGHFYWGGGLIILTSQSV